MKKLNEEQKEAANFLNGICAVIAVPGSGKTMTMTERIGILVKQHSVSPESIVGLTFTRNAAKEMTKRLKPVLNELADRVTLSTIHSFCLYLLKSEGKVFNILSEFEQIKFLRFVMKGLKVKNISVGTVIREISLAKANLLSVNDFRDLHADDSTMEKIADIFASYEREKAKKMLLDFDDLLIETYKMLTERQDVMDRLKERFRHVLVDEFQDTNPSQMEILKLLINESDNSWSFWVCGDDWQSIYGWNGASVGNLLKFQDVFPKAKQFILHINYRSTPQILTACRNLISYNERKIEKPLTPHNEVGDDVVIMESLNEEDEAETVAHEIMDLVERKGYSYKEIALLYRANFQSRVIEEVFSNREIPYQIENGVHFFKRREIKILLDYLRVVSDPDSDEGDEALINIINVPNRYMGRKFVQELKEFSSEIDIHLYQGLKTRDTALSYLKKNVKEFVGILDPLIENSESLTPSETIQLLRNALDYDRFITEDDIPSPDDEKIANLNQLQLAATKFDTIEAFLHHTDRFQGKSRRDKNGVRCMTIHKAKGMEFPVVFMIGLVQGILPSKKGENMEEERRICFVGMSRVMKLLFLSHSQNYLGQPSKRSIFLDEISESRK